MQTTCNRVFDGSYKITEQDEKDLEEILIELMNQKSTYCVGARDQVQDSYDELIEGLRF